MSFLEDDIALKGLEMMVQKNAKKKIQQAAVNETLELLKMSKEKQALQLRSLLGPRGGLPRLKNELMQVAVLLHVEVNPDDTVDTLRLKLKEPVLSLTSSSTWSVPVAKVQSPPPPPARQSQPSSGVSGLRMKSTSPTPPQPQVPKMSLQEQLALRDRGVLGAADYDPAQDPSTLSPSGSDHWSVAGMETDFHQLEEIND